MCSASCSASSRPKTPTSSTSWATSPYALSPMTRVERAEHAKLIVDSRFNAAQSAFLDFVLSHYVAVGVEELGPDKLVPLLKLKYGDSIHDALDQVGKDVGTVFSDFQQYLYESQAG